MIDIVQVERVWRRNFVEVDSRRNVVEEDLKVGGKVLLCAVEPYQWCYGVLVLRRYGVIC